MKLRTKVLAFLSSVMALVTLLLPAGAMAQRDGQAAAGIALLGAFFMIYLVFILAIYVYTALALMTIAQKTNTENGWLAWIPIANVVLMCNIAGKPIWWIILCFIPLVNIVIFIMLWMGIAEARNKPSWWGVLLIVPLVGLVVPGYLAWSE